MYFKIIGKITNIETIAISHSIRELALLQEQYGAGRWRKLKGFEKSDGTYLRELIPQIWVSYEQTRK